MKLSMFILGILLAVVLLTGGRAFADELPLCSEVNAELVECEHTANEWKEIDEYVTATENENPPAERVMAETSETPATPVESTPPSTPRVETAPAYRVSVRVRGSNGHVHCPRHSTRTRKRYKGRAKCRAIRKTKRS